MKHTLLLLLLVTNLLNCTSQPPPEFTTTQLRTDFDLYRKALEEAHPGLYRYRTRQQFDSLFEMTRESLNTTSTLVEFYEQLSSINSFIGCGHTRTMLPVEISKAASEKRLPFEIKVIDHKAFISKSFVADEDYVIGTEVIAIEYPFAQISKRMVNMMTADGYVQSSKRRDIERSISSFLQLFVKADGPYRAVMRKPDGSEVTKSISLIKASQIPAPESLPDLEFEIHNGGTVALLTIRSFMSNVTDEHGNGFTAFLKQSFEEINERKIDKLIIDVRGNGGGRDDYGSLLYSYLTEEPYHYYSYLEIKEPNFTFLEHTNKSQSFLNELRSSATRTNDGRWLLNENQHSCLPVQNPNQPTFKGKVIVLIDGGSFSATAEFCAVTRFHERATFVGEETSGGYEGNNSGGSILLTLPETKIRLAIPTYKYVSAVDIDAYPKGRGIIPHHEVKPSINGLANSTDEILTFALRQVQK